MTESKYSTAALIRGTRFDIGDAPEEGIVVAHGEGGGMLYKLVSA